MTRHPQSATPRPIAAPYAQRQREAGTLQPGASHPRLAHPDRDLPPARRVLRGAWLGALLTASFAVAAPANAETEGPWAQERGFSVGLQFLTNVIGAEDPGADPDPDGIYVDETGGGATLSLGYTFVPAFALRLALGVARHETTQSAVEAFYNTVTLEAHWRFLPEERARPYLFGALGGAGFMLDTERYESETSGGLASLGAGLLYNLTRHLVVDLNTRLDLINWDQVEVSRQLPGGGEVALEAPIDEDGSAWRFQLGLAWEF